MPTDPDIAWAAGLFEGEGTWHLHAPPSAQASVSSTDRDVLERFERIVGFGSIRVQRAAKGHHKTCYYWVTASGILVRRLIELFWPYLGARRRARAEEILRGTASIGRRGRSKHQTHCMRGHIFDEKNTGYRTGKGYKGRTYTTRYCKHCTKERARQRWAGRNG